MPSPVGKQQHLSLRPKMVLLHGKHIVIIINKMMNEAQFVDSINFLQTYKDALACVE